MNQLKLLFLSLICLSAAHAATTAKTATVRRVYYVSPMSAAFVGSAMYSTYPYYYNPYYPEPSTFAPNSCPTYQTRTAPGCAASENMMWLSLNQCNRDDGKAIWNGTVAWEMSQGTAECGMFPSPGAGGSLGRQFVTGVNSKTPGSATVTNSSGDVLVLDDASANLSNFDKQTIAPLLNGGYGSKIDFAADGTRATVEIAKRIQYADELDLSITGSLTVKEASTDATSRTLNGSLLVYHNHDQVMGTSTFDNITLSNNCCSPNAGSITTMFSAGKNVAPTADGAQLVGKTESLTFTGCGAATLVKADGSSENITIDDCF